MKVIEVINKIKDLDQNIEELKALKANIQKNRFYSDELSNFLEQKIKEMEVKKKESLNLKIDISTLENNDTNDMSVLKIQDTKNKVKDKKEYENKKKIIYRY